MPDDATAKRTVALRYDGGEHEMQVTEPTEGSAGVDLGKLLAQTGLVTLDPGFVNTAACKSDITYIDGDAGILRYRGYPIEELAAKSNFIEVSYLLIYGELPTREQYEDFQHRITTHTMVHEDIKLFFNGFPRSAHPCLLYTSDAADE